MDAMGKFDVVIIGAGISGIYAAKFYLDIHPSSRLIILDRDSCIGGTWNSRRGYDEFWTQWTVGTAEFSDLPMPRPPEEDIYYEFFKAKYTTKYLETYVDHHSYGGKTLRDRIKLDIQVESIVKTDGEWIMSAKEQATEIEHTFNASKLMIASGLTCIPSIPSFPGQEAFKGRFLHHNDFGCSNVLTSPNIKNITVLGGGKSSADMVYSAVKAGKTVSWVLKATETTGPGFFFSPKGKGPYKNAFEIGMTRMAATFTPSFMNEDSLWTRFLHSTRAGVKLMASFWGTVDQEARKEADFTGRKSLQGFDKLSPHSPIFWQNGTGGLLNHADFFDTVAQNVRIFSADILGLEEDKIRLKTNETIPADAILCGTGWVPSLQFFSEEQKRLLGLPHQRSEESAEEAQQWAQLETSADEKVLATFPLLAKPPPHYHRPAIHTPYRLYKHIVPIPVNDVADDRSIVFIGQITVGNYFPAVECQSMWATAYMDGKLKLPDREERLRDVASCTTWCRRRYLSGGEKGNNITFDLVGYMDGLLQDLGLQSHLKGWFRHYVSPVVATDLEGLRGEYFVRFGRDEAV